MKIRKLTLNGYKRFRSSNIRSFVAEFPYQVSVIIGSNGSGKAQPVDDPIKTPGGWKRMGDIKVNDYVTAVDGTAARVLGVYPQGYLPLLRVKFSDDRYIDVPKDHLWTVYDTFHPQGVVLNTFQIAMGISRGQKYHIDTCVPEVTKDTDFVIPPYLYGALLAKGNFINHPLTMTARASVAEHIGRLLPHNTKMEVTLNAKDEHYVFLKFLQERGYESGLETKLRDLGLYNRMDPEKYISEYFINKASADQKFEFLKGMIDNIAYVSDARKARDKRTISHFSMWMNSPRLAEGVRQIIFSLGGTCSITPKKQFKYYANEYVPGNTVYILSIRFADPNLAVNEPYKKINLKSHLTGRDHCRLKISEVRALPTKAECQCIMIDHPKHLYVTKDYLVTHNTSLLNELNPLPSVRTDFEKDGSKIMEIEHDGHEYVLSSDFTNKNSPHSFVVDGRELNIGHTTDIQTELVEKHFGVTADIRDLIYNKIRLSQTTKSERKNLFLKINPMDLGLLVDTHKKALSTIKDCKAQLNLLQSRKVDLESKMIAPELLAQHKKTKENLEQQDSLLQKIIYTIYQHTETILSKFKDDIEYMKTHENSIPIDSIIKECKNLRDNIRQFTDISRGDEFYTEKENLKGKQQELSSEKANIAVSISTLSREINEFQIHLEKATDRPISKIETEIQNIDKELLRFVDLKLATIPYDLIDIHREIVDNVDRLVKVFVHANTSMVKPEIVTAKIFEFKELKNNIKLISEQIDNIHNKLSNLSQEQERLQYKAKVPEACNFQCGLRAIFIDRLKRIETEREEYTRQLKEGTVKLDKYKEEYGKLADFVEPFMDSDLVNKYNQLKSVLSSSYFNIFKDDDDLIFKLNTQPIRIVTTCRKSIDESILKEEQRRLNERRTKLKTELDTLLKTSDTSLEFLKTELAKKEAIVKEKLQNLDKVGAELTAVDTKYNLYLEYSLACNKIHEFQEKYSRAERHILIKNAYKYWNNLQKHYEQIQINVREELRTIETIVKDQDLIIHTYKTEILPFIEKINKEKGIYERLELALSPNSGVPHRSMVRYLNTMIHNVNYFLSQIWAYPMKLVSVDENSPLDYGFPITIKNETNKDINCTSDGQAEVIDLVWVLTILLQMKLLDKIPFFADEIGRCMDEVHRQKTLDFLNSLIDNRLIEQLFLINHYAAISNGFKECNVICLNSDNLTDLPNNVNEHVKIEYY